VVASVYDPSEEQRAIWVLLEFDDETLADVSFELLEKGRELADEVDWPLVGVLLGHQVEPLASLALSHQADNVILIDHPILKSFSVDAYAHAFHHVILQEKPSVILFGATHNSRDIAGRLAVRLRTGLNADCIDLRMDKERGILISDVTGFGGGVVALLEAPDHRPQMATVRPGAFEPEDPTTPRSKQFRSLAVELDESVVRTRIIERVKGEGISIAGAPVLVSGGRGISGNFQMLEELAELLGGDVGATRPPVDEGHIERERQVGQTGVMCRPKIALNCGISGAFHFVVGIQDAELIVSINSDPDAPIFEFSDYCVVGDVEEILPALIQTLKEEREVAHA
jgi:electron transfer flavoprotein alpha subunit